MAENRESCITVKSKEFKDEDTKFQVLLKVDFGTKQCNERINYIKNYGMDPPNNCALITHEFETEEAAKNCAAKVEEFKGEGGPLGIAGKHIECYKTVGNKLVVSWRADANFIKDMEVMHEFATFLGDFASINQHLEFKIADSRGIKDIFVQNPQVSPMATFLSGFCCKLTLSARKDLPLKIGDFVATKVPEYEQKEVKMASRLFASFHHLNLEVDLADPSQEMKSTLKKEIMMGVSAIGGMIYQMGEQMGLLEIAKHGGNTTKLVFCVTPLVSFEITFFAPGAYETIEKINSPEFAQSMLPQSQ